MYFVCSLYWKCHPPLPIHFISEPHLTKEHKINTDITSFKIKISICITERILTVCFAAEEIQIFPSAISLLPHHERILPLERLRGRLFSLHDSIHTFCQLRNKNEIKIQVCIQKSVLHLAQTN